MVCGSGNNGFAKTICSICYEDLKPIVEDLQSISICGHVFHELCLQQWFEYCSNRKKKNCPVCKQACAEANVGRLYFQSVGDPTQSQKPVDCEENPAELRMEVEKLKGKVLGLNSALERQEKDVEDLTKELLLSKEKAKTESALKDEALRQKVSIQQLLRLKSEELDRSTLECARVQERNMALAKELAALKLASDLNLEEEEILKLASLGNQTNNKDTIDVLKKTLIMRNKSYKELMAKCNVLGRGEARYLRKLEKTKEKMKKLKIRIQELETSVELRDNEVLRALKVSKKATWGGATLGDVNEHIDYAFEEPTGQKINLNQTKSKTNNINCTKLEKPKPCKADKSTACLDKGIGSFHLMDVETPEIITSIPDISQPCSKVEISEDLSVWTSCLSRKEGDSDTKNEAVANGLCVKDGVLNSMTGKKGDILNASSDAMDDEMVLLLDDIKQVPSFLPVRKETQSPVPIAQPGDLCFSGGLLGPDGAKRHLGKWCKRVQGKESATASTAVQGTSAPSNLIVVGADGRGGKIKVLRSLHESTLDGKETSTWAKKCKYGAKTGSLQSQGCLQIEHFFRRAGQ
ncbi:uncharacterized protein LOC127801222 [Diospyros lotus]|uniref:uncharacterized protein LOC127801222 n=1 Tax=Diospyros lotus TaxID=55363 RepID=UPI002258745F|nr:uncharacterized protein LOC127801222 [Diospyros lotus]